MRLLESELVSGNNLKSAVGKQPAQVLILDDQPVFCCGLRMMLADLPDLEVCGEFGDYQQAMAAMRGCPPDLVTIEISLRRSSGLDFIKEVRRRFPKVLLLVITVQSEAHYAEQALRSGASGFINKHESLVSILRAIKIVLRGGIYVSEKIASRIVSTIAGRRDESASVTNLLAERELQVFELIGEGLGPNQIGQKLKINKSTVETYRGRIRKKLRIKNAGELRKKAIQWNHLNHQ